MTWSTAVYAVWSAVATGALALWWVTATGRTLAGRHVARAGALVRELLRRPLFRLVVIVGWMWLGWHLFAR